MNTRDEGAARAARENRMSDEPLLSVEGLAVDFATMDGVVHAVEGVDLEIRPGETVAIVGESGSGKSTTAMAIIGLLAGGGKVAAGSIRLDGREIAHASENELRTIRGRDIGLVPQDPMSNLNPVAKIGTQVAETLLAHGLATRQNVQGKVVEALTEPGEVGRDPRRGRAEADHRDDQSQADQRERAEGEQDELVGGHSRRPYRPRTIRRIRSQRSLTAASAPRDVGR